MTEEIKNNQEVAETVESNRPEIGQQIIVASFDEKTPEGFLQFLNATIATSGTYKEIVGKKLKLTDVLVYADTKPDDNGEIKTEEVGVIYTEKGTFGGVAANINTTLKALAGQLHTTLKGKEVTVTVVDRKSKGDRTFYILEMSM